MPIVTPLRYAAVAIVWALPVASQVNTASIVGRVVDKTNAALPNARVTARHLSTNLARTATASADGSFGIPSLPIGTYEMSAEAPSFQKEIRTGIALATGEIARLEFTLNPSAVTESVTVTGAAPMVNTTSPELGTVIDPAKVVDLPLNGRNFTQLVTLQPGVIRQNFRGATFVFNGLTNFGMNITLDGTDASFIETPTFGEMSSNSLLNAVSLETIAEVRVQTGAFTAEVGRASSGGLNVVTRSGTNEFHGALFHFFRNDKLDARNFFAATKPPLRQNQYGGNLGGRAVRDKIFFFGSYEGVTRRVGRIVTDVVPTAAFRAAAPAIYKPLLDRVPLPDQPVDANTGIHRRNDNFKDDENLASIKGDHHAGKYTTFLRYSINKSENSSPTLLPANRLVFPGSNHQVTLSNTAIVGPSAINELRLGFNRWLLPRRNTTFEENLGWLSIRNVLTGVLEGKLQWADTGYTVADSFALRQGRHSLKAGFEVRRIQANRIQQENTRYQYDTVADFLANRVNTVRLIFGTAGMGFRQTQTGLYFQDDFQVLPRLTFNLGVRYEYYTPLKEAVGRTFNVVSDPFGEYRPKGSPLYNPDRNNINPRVGFAWDVTGKQRTAIRGGVGVYSSPFAPFWAMDQPTVDPRIPFAADLRIVDVPGLQYPLPAAFEQARRNPLQALQLGIVPTVLGRRTIDPFLRDTYSTQWNLSLQQQFTRSWAMQATYAGNRNIKTSGSRNLNLVDPALRGRPFPAIGQIDLFENSGRRGYHSLQLSLRKRASHGVTSDLYYTWGHTIVYAGEDAGIQDMSNLAGSMGNANLDIRHVLNWSVSWEIPTKKFAGGAFAERVLGGWSVQTICQAQTGGPVNITSGRDVRGDATGAQRPNYLGGSQYAENKTIDRWFNPAAFALPANGTFGNLGRNTARGPGSFNLDLSLIKRTQIRENHTLQFRAEAFALPNNPVFANPNAATTASTFGRILSAGGSRNLQLGLRYEF